MPRLLEIIDHMEECRQGRHEIECIGGANAGCCDECVCSVAVYGCKHCGASDYGDTQERLDIIASCRAENARRREEAQKIAKAVAKSFEAQMMELDRFLDLFE